MIFVKIVRLQDFPLLKNDWKKLEKGKDMTGFQSYSWYSIINNQYLKKAADIPGKPVYAVVYDNDEIKMIAPLLIVKLPSFFSKFGLKSGAYILGKGGFTDYLNFIYSEFRPEYFKAVINTIKKEFRVKHVFIHQILKNTDIDNFILSDFPDSFEFNGDCTKINVKSNFEEYYNCISKNLRQNIKKAQNKAIKRGVNIHYEIMNSVSLKDASEFYSIYQKRCISRETSNTKKKDILFFIKKIWNYINNKHRSDFNFIIESMTKLENSFILGFYFENKKIGFCFGVNNEDSVMLPIVCYDTDYSEYSPGIVCIYNFIKDSYSNNSVKTFDITRGTERYKIELGGTVFQIGYYDLKI